MRNVRRTRRFLLLLLAVWLLFIWVHSMIPARSSAAESRWVGQLITPVLELFTGKGNKTTLEGYLFLHSLVISDMPSTFHLQLKLLSLFVCLSLKTVIIPPQQR